MTTGGKLFICLFYNFSFSISLALPPSLHRSAQLFPHTHIHTYAHAHTQTHTRRGAVCGQGAGAGGWAREGAFRARLQGRCPRGQRVSTVGLRTREVMFMEEKKKEEREAMMQKEMNFFSSMISIPRSVFGDLSHFT